MQRITSAAAAAGLPESWPFRAREVFSKAGAACGKIWNKTTANTAEKIPLISWWAKNIARENGIFVREDST